MGLRVPDHPVALALLDAFGGGIAERSANRFGRVSPTSAAHVVAEFGDAVDCVIDGGSCTVGLESTILDLSGQYPRVLRPGAVMPDVLTHILGESLSLRAGDSPRAPGCLASHYAPDTPLRLIDTTEIEAAAQSFLNFGQSVAVLSVHPPATNQAGCRWLMMPADPKEYGQVLYARLREIDTWDCHCVPDLIRIRVKSSNLSALHLQAESQATSAPGVAGEYPYSTYTAGSG